MTPAPVVRALLDSPIVIEYRDALPAAVQLFAEIRRTRFPEFSAITAMILIGRCQDAADRIGIVQFFLPISTVHPLNLKVSRRAHSLLEAIPPPCGLTADDAIVAATALEHKLPVYTLDPARFAGVAGLAALRPY